MICQLPRGGEKESGENPSCAVADSHVAGAGGSRADFLLAWFFPSRQPEMCVKITISVYILSQVTSDSLCLMLSGSPHTQPPHRAGIVCIYTLWIIHKEKCLCCFLPWSDLVLYGSRGILTQESRSLEHAHSIHSPLPPPSLPTTT